MSVVKRFELSAKIVKNLKGEPTDEEKLKLYGLYKQSTIGNCNTPQPFVLSIKDNAKWKAWNYHNNKSSKDAMNEYSDFVVTLIHKYDV